MAEIERATEIVSKPASVNWTLARVAALLLPYYEKETPQAIREIEAEDWLASLDGLPQWAIERAVRWWKGPDNPDRRKRPMEGDIAERARREIASAKAVAIVLRNRDRYSQVEEPRKRMSAARAAQIMEEVGFRPRTFGQD